MDNEDRNMNFFDYKIRADLKKKCKEMKVRLSKESDVHNVLIDVITLVSDGSHEDATKNLQETVNFMANYRTTINRMIDPTSHTGWQMDMEDELEHLYWTLIHRFWKTYLIKVLVSHKRKIKPKYKPYESLKRSQFFVAHTSTITQFRSASMKEEERLSKIQEDLNAEYQGKAASALVKEEILRADIEFE